MQSMQDKMRELETDVQKLKACTAQIDKIEKERSSIAKELEFKILMLHNMVMNQEIFRLLDKK